MKFRVLILFTAFLFAGGNLFAYGKTDTDSIKLLLKSEKDVGRKVLFLLDLGQHYVSENKDTAILYLESAFQLAAANGNIAAQSKASAILGMVYQYEDQVKSTKYIFQALELAEQSGDETQLAYVYNIVGSHYRVNGELDKSIGFYNKSLAIRERTKDSLGIAVCYNNLGICYMMSAVYDTGLFFWEKSLEMKLAIRDSLSAAYTMANIAIYYKDINRIFEALQYTEKALDIELRNNDFTGASHSCLLMGEIYNKTENFPKAVSWFNKALVYADTAGSQFDKLEPLIGLAASYEGQEDYKNAYKTLREYLQINQKYTNETTEKISREMQTQYETEKKEKENLLLKSENVTKDLKLKEEAARNELQQARNIYLLIGLLLALGLLGVIIFALRRVRQSKLQVEEQKHIVEEKNKEITDSINYAKRIQAAILPPDKLIKQLLPESFVLYKPKDIVAGDFYWLQQTDKKILIAAADCTGHGVPGAMVSVVCNNALNRAVREYGMTDPGKILDKTRDLVIEEFEKSAEEVKDGMDISLCSISLKDMTLEWAGANNPLWILKKREPERSEVNADMSAETSPMYELIEVKADKQPIGKYADAKPFSTKSVNLEKGDSVYIFTDGYQDQFGGDKGKKFKAAQMKDIVLSVTEKQMEEQKNILNQTIENWKGKLEQIDDICVIGFRV